MCVTAHRIGGHILLIFVDHGAPKRARKHLDGLQAGAGADLAGGGGGPGRGQAG